MEIKQKVEREVVVGWTCDVCGKSCNASEDGRYEAHEHASLYAYWGYHSNKDLETHNCDLCENCYDRIREYIETLGGKVRVTGDE